MKWIDPDECARAWAGAVRERLRTRWGSGAEPPFAEAMAEAVGRHLADTVGEGALPEEAIDGMIDWVLCRVGYDGWVRRALGVPEDDERWACALEPRAPALLRGAVLRGWLRPLADRIARPRAWRLDLSRLFRDEPTGLELNQFRWLGALLDSVAAYVATRGHCDEIWVSAEDDPARAAVDRRRVREVLQFCESRLAETARRAGLATPPRVIRCAPRARRRCRVPS